MVRPTSPLRPLASLLAPALLLLVAATTLSAAGRRRSVALPSSGPLPLPLPPGEPPAPGPVLAGTIDDFECLAAGQSALLRVHAGAGIPRDDAVLVIDREDEMEIVTPLPEPLTGGAIGFACERTLIDDAPVFWLQAGGVTHSLGAPRIRAI